ncbi:MAG: hypothetical protein OEZ22_09025 [Spirochaetia bacterium]|nr:hypothetical protein [Spirochaetia bacterium]
MISVQQVFTGKYILFSFYFEVKNPIEIIGSINFNTSNDTAYTKESECCSD